MARYPDQVCPFLRPLTDSNGGVSKHVSSTGNTLERHVALDRPKCALVFHNRHLHVRLHCIGRGLLSSVAARAKVPSVANPNTPPLLWLLLQALLQPMQATTFLVKQFEEHMVRMHVSSRWAHVCCWLQVRAKCRCAQGLALTKLSDGGC